MRSRVKQAFSLTNIGFVDWTDLGEQNPIQKNLKNRIHRAIDSGQRQRWSFMTILYLGVRSPYYARSWKAVPTILNISGALPWTYRVYVCVEGLAHVWHLASEVGTVGMNHLSSTAPTYRVVSRQSRWQMKWVFCTDACHSRPGATNCTPSRSEWNSWPTYCFNMTTRVNSCEFIGCLWS